MGNAMKLEFEIDGQLPEALEQLRENGVQSARESLINDLARETLQATHDGNPVATGRSQAGWSAALAQLGGTGASGTVSSEGQASRTDTDESTSITATNSVPYITFLEYGTSKMPPVAMLRSALASVIGRIPQLFRIES